MKFYHYLLETETDVPLEEKKILKHQVITLVIHNSFVNNKDRDGIPIREKEAIIIGKISKPDYKNAVKELLNKKLIDMNGNLTNFGKAYLDEVELRDMNKTEDIVKYIKDGPVDWMESLYKIGKKDIEKPMDKPTDDMNKPDNNIEDKGDNVK